MSRSLFLRRLRKYVAALPALAFGFMASPAFSATVTINASGVTAGTTSASFLGATLTSTGGKFTTTTTVGTNPSTVIGVSGGSVSNEIDISGDKITLNFGSTGAIVNEITLGLLFRSGVSGNVYDEAAHLQTNGGTACASGALSPCILSAAGVWRGATAGIQILSPATSGNGGIFKITNPFTSALINSIDFKPWGIPPGVGGATNSDFGVVSITYTTTAIPEPGTFAMVGLGILGLAFAGGKRKRV